MFAILSAAERVTSNPSGTTIDEISFFDYPIYSLTGMVKVLATSFSNVLERSNMARLMEERMSKSKLNSKSKSKSNNVYLTMV